MQNSGHVAFASNLTAFVEEIPPGLTDDASGYVEVRLASWSKFKAPEGMGYGWRTFVLGLSGVTKSGDLLMLTYQVPVQTFPHESWKAAGEKGQAVFDAWPGLEQLVRDFLEGDGYVVRDGIHAIPENLTPLNGTFDVVRWDKGSNCYVYDERWRAEEVKTEEATA